MRASPKDILIWTMVRQVLVTVARMSFRLEGNEFARFKQTLLDEIAAIEPGKELSEIWIQAATAMNKEAAHETGLAAYGLERIGLWPATPPQAGD
jgi:hypothetical protein